MSACRFDSSTHYQYPRPHPPRPQARARPGQLTVALQIRMNTSEPTASKARLPHTAGEAAVVVRHPRGIKRCTN